MTTLHRFRQRRFAARHAAAIRATLVAVLAAALALASTSASAVELNLHGLLGLSHQKGGDGRFVSGLRADLGEPAWFVRPEIGWQYHDALLGDRAETELSAGAVRYWLTQPSIHLGGGVSDVSYRFLGVDGSKTGAYAHTGVTWTLGRGGFLLGADARYGWVPDAKVNGVSLPLEYRQVAVMLGWRF